MATTWTIEKTEFTLDEARLPDRITRIFWRCDVTDGNISRTARNTLPVDEDPDTYTEQDALNAVQAQFGYVAVALQAALDRQAAPTTGFGLPWEAQFPEWATGVAYAVNDVISHLGVAYACIQAHTSQSNWAPPSVPALFAVVQDPTNPALTWVAGEVVNVGDRRWYPTTSDTEYQAIQGHTTQVGWEPPNVPALWGAV